MSRTLVSAWTRSRAPFFLLTWGGSCGPVLGLPASLNHLPSTSERFFPVDEVGCGRLWNLSLVPASPSCFSPAYHLFLARCKLARGQRPGVLRPEPPPLPVPSFCTWRFLICSSLNFSRFLLISLPYVPFPNGWNFLLIISSLPFASKTSLLLCKFGPEWALSWPLSNCPQCLSSLSPVPTVSRSFCTVAQLRFLAFCPSYTNHPFKNNKGTSLVPYFVWSPNSLALFRVLSTLFLLFRKSRAAGCQLPEINSNSSSLLTYLHAPNCFFCLLFHPPFFP